MLILTLLNQIYSISLHFTFALLASIVNRHISAIHTDFKSWYLTFGAGIFGYSSIYKAEQTTTEVPYRFNKKTDIGRPRVGSYITLSHNFDLL